MRRHGSWWAVWLNRAGAPPVEAQTRYIFPLFPKIFSKSRPIWDTLGKA
jgi:hypothetical protein